MRYLIVTDIHGNSTALETVLERAAEEPFDHILVLGDLVGYGAGPNEVVEIVRRFELPAHVIRGNHDKVVARLDDSAGFNRVAQAAVEWTIGALSEENLEYVRRLPRGPVEVEPGVSICHGSPLDEDQYLLSTDQAQRVFESDPSRVSFFGHTHIPTLFSGDARSADVRILEPEEGEIELDPEIYYLINPGSVGQPRDRDPRAAYMIFDSERSSARLYRVDYPLEEAQRKIVDAGLPPVLAQRLSVGI